MIVCTCNILDPWDLLANHPNLISELKAKETLSPITKWLVLRNKIWGWPLASTYIHTNMSSYFYFEIRALCRSGWLQTHFIVLTCLKFSTLIPRLPECWAHRHMCITTSRKTVKLLRPKSIACIQVSLTQLSVSKMNWRYRGWHWWNLYYIYNYMII